MTEQEAMFCLKAESERYPEICNECPLYGEVGCDHCFDDAMDVAIKALEEIQQYLEIGTPEECQAAVEKQKAKKPIEPDEEYGTFKCPNCGGLIFTEDRFETHKHCLLCGQKLDWRDEE